MAVGRRELGRAGEEAAAAWYEERGYRVLDRNWRCRDGELDLVLSGPAALVFCEVKTRSSLAFGAPAEAVTRTKQVRLRRLAAQWLAAHPGGGGGGGGSGGSGRRAGGGRDIRFDVACVMDGQVEVIEGAF